MANDEPSNAIDTLVSVARTAKNVAHFSTQIVRAHGDWDVETLTKASKTFTQNLTTLADLWNENRTVIEDATFVVRDKILADDYPTQLEDALRKRNIPIQGAFPEYQFPPFRLEVQTDEPVIRLVMGRKQQKTTALRPDVVAKWVSVHYDGIVNRAFSRTRFCRDLLTAYELANRLAFHENKIAWSRAVALKQVYELLTVSQGARQDYPLLLFQYQLGRLREEFDVRHDEYRFEFGFARDQRRAYLVVDSTGREQRISSLTVYRDENAT